MRTRSLILLVLLVTLAFLGAAWLIVQPCLAADYTGKVVAVIDGDTIEVLHHQHPERIRLSGIDQRRARPMARRPSRRPLPSPSEKKSPFRPTASTSTNAPLETCSCSMARTSITRWSKMVGAGGIENMRQEIRRWKGWRRKHERRGKDYGLIRSPCRRGSGGSGRQWGGELTPPPLNLFLLLALRRLFHSSIVGFFAFAAFRLLCFFPFRPLAYCFSVLV